VPEGEAVSLINRDSEKQQVHRVRRSTKRCLNAGSAMMARTSALILSTIGRGVFAATAMPNQVPAV